MLQSQNRYAWLNQFAGLRQRFTRRQTDALDSAKILPRTALFRSKLMDRTKERSLSWPARLAGLFVQGSYAAVNGGVEIKGVGESPMARRCFFEVVSCRAIVYEN